MVKINNIVDFKELYDFHLTFNSSYMYKTSLENYVSSLLYDVDRENNTLFKQNNLLGAFIDNKLVGFIQYGISAIGFDDNGNITNDINYQIIRQLYFLDDKVGEKLLDIALNSFDKSKRIYAFFHYFGMSCFSSHGKLDNKNINIEKLLLDNKFEIEHENIYYSLKLSDDNTSNITLKLSDINSANKQNIIFLDNDNQIGECELHFVNKDLTYLRWIYINNEMQHKGYGSKCINKLKSYLFNKGFKLLDTDTAIDNIVAQNFYIKNGFINKAITKSYLLNNKKVKS